MALLKKITLDNGVELNYHKVAGIEVNKEITKVRIYSFISKEFYTKALNKKELQLKQNELINEFDELNNKEKLTKAQETKVNKLVEEINNLANEINETAEFETYIILESVIEIPTIENFNLTSIEKELLKSDNFKSAKIVA